MLYVLFEKTHNQICIYKNKGGYSVNNQQKGSKVDGRDELARILQSVVCGREK